MNKREPIGKKLRFSIFERDGFACTYCGRTPEEDDVILHVDHVISVKDGGNNDKDNLVTSCFDCNSGKGAKSVLRGKQTVESLKEELTIANERLEQLRQLTKLKKKLLGVNKKSSDEKTNWIRSIMGDGYNEKLYSSIGEYVGKYYANMPVNTVADAVRITNSKNDKKPFDSVGDFVKYFGGVLRNLNLTPEQQTIIRKCNNFFSEHHTQMFAYAKKMILDNSELGEEFFDNVMGRVVSIIAEHRGKSFKCREDSVKYTKVNNFIVFGSGFNFNVLFCEGISLELEDL